MSFLSPGFLFALSALAIPVIIHLFNFRKFKKVYFSNVRFLKFVEVQSSSRRQLKDKLILAARLLALTFLILAFARPYIPNPEQDSAFERQAVSIYIDNSYSMEAVNREGTLLDEAKRRAREIVSAYSLNDKFQLLTNDFEGRHQRLVNSDEFLSSLEEVQISPLTRDLSEILPRQTDVFRSEPNIRKSAYLISDFQNNILPGSPLQADTAVNVRLVRLRANPQPNISIDTVYMLSAIHRPGEPEHVVVRLKNNSDEPAENVPIRLLVNSQQKALGSAKISARSTALDTLSFSGLSAGWQEGEITINDFPVTFDDKFYFSFFVRESMPVLVINGGAINEYINAVYRADPYFTLTNTPIGNINYSQLSSFPLVILNEAAAVSDGLVQQLQSYVNKGGSLIIFPNLTAGLEDLGRMLRSLQTDTPGEVVSGETRVEAINLRHPVFTGVFESIPQKLDLPVARKYLKYNLSGRSNRNSILEIAGKGVFFSEYRHGLGKIYLSAVPLDAESSNFARHSVFVPIMYQTALLALRHQNLFHKISDEQAIDLPKITLNVNQSLTLTKDGFEAIPDLRQTDNGSRIFVADQVRESGNYNLMKGDSLLSVLSFNDPGPESDLSYASEGDVADKFPGQKIDQLTPRPGSMEGSVKTINQGIPLWKLCVVLSLLFLAAEVLLIRYFTPKVTINPDIA